MTTRNFDLDFANICREERCPQPGIHAYHGAVHRVRGGHRGSFLVRVTTRELILESVYNAISDRFLKAFTPIYCDVRNDYGTLKERAVYRALAALVSDRQVAVIVPQGSDARLRAGGFVRGGYIRMSSPLLWQTDGLQTLADQVDDLRAVGPS